MRLRMRKRREPRADESIEGTASSSSSREDSKATTGEKAS
jgi:hypothetical protein